MDEFGAQMEGGSAFDFVKRLAQPIAASPIDINRFLGEFLGGVAITLP